MKFYLLFALIFFIQKSFPIKFALIDQQTNHMDPTLNCVNNYIWLCSWQNFLFARNKLIYFKLFLMTPKLWPLIDIAQTIKFLGGT